MTIQEVADSLNVSRYTILRVIDEIFQCSKVNIEKIQGTHGGRAQYLLDESQVTAIKLNLKKTEQVKTAPKTELETDLIIQQGYLLLQERVERYKVEAERLALENEKKQALITEQAPKIETFEKFLDKGALANFTETAKEIGLKPHHFIDLLVADKYVFKDTKGNIRPYNNYVPKYLKIVDFVTGSLSGQQTLVTPEGRHYFYHKYANNTIQGEIGLWTD
jgi:phage antirepressor YoqD-like protein